MSSIRSRRSAVAITIACALAVLLVAEGVARLLEPRLPEPLLWHSQETQVKVGQMEDHRPVSVVVVGSSLVAYGLDADIMAGEMGVGVYNAGLSAGFSVLTEAWTTQVVLPLLQPRLVVVGVGSFDLTDHAANDIFLDAFQTSLGGRRSATTGDRLADATAWFAERSVLWRHRAAVRQPWNLLQAVWGATPSAPEDVASITTLGRVTWLENRRFDPMAEPGPTLPVDDWMLGVEAPAALSRLIEQVRAQDVEVVIVTMPTTDRHVQRHPEGELSHRAYLQAVLDLAARHSVGVLRHDRVRDPDLFADEVHLNGAGAAELSLRIARELDTCCQNWK